MTTIDAATVRRALRDEGLRARHGLSQNFLADPAVLERILVEADPRPGRRILEIGPGLGVLTEALLAAGAAVTAVELDIGLANRLRRELAEAIERADREPAVRGGLRLIGADILDLDVATIVERPYDVVANLPYHVTSPVLHRLLGDEPRPDRAVLMLQREVAERIAAAPGRMSYLSAFVQYHARVRIAELVPPAAFEPAPEVWSAIVVIEPYRPDDHDAPPRLPSEHEDDLWRLVQAGFRERRKMLHNVLGRQLPIPAERLAAALARTGITPDRRPQTLSVHEWIALLETLGPIAPDSRGRRRSAGSPSDAPGPADAAGPNSPGPPD
jgi:16S rRNA (adenine1518-N6/adenine1519-N6)-dimethyltransferase